jgi:hypothetical protein
MQLLLKLHRAYMTICLGTFCVLTPNTCIYLTFQSFNFERHLMKIIPETRRVH